MLALLPLLALVLCACLIRARCDTQPWAATLRDQIFAAATACAAWVVAGTEILSLGHALSFWPVLCWWLAAVIPLTVLVLRNRARLRLSTPALSGLHDPFVLVFVALTVVLILATGLVAAHSPTQNWDSQTYHLPRQLFWQQQASVAPFATSNPRQLQMPPFAEFVSLHLMLLAQSDRWANAVQWLSLGLTALCGSLVARQLDAGRVGQALAAFAIVANPMALHQATSAKNDLVLSFWAVLLGSIALRVQRSGRVDRPTAVQLGITVGLMGLTKGTGLVIALPFWCWITVVWLRRDLRRAVTHIGAAGLIVLALMAGHSIRNYEIFGNINGAPPSRGGYPLLNEVFGIRPFVSVFVRNVALHLGMPSPDWNEHVGQGVESVHRALGVPLNDPRTSFYGLSFEVPYAPQIDDLASAPAHLLLLVLLGGALLWRPRADARLGLYCLAAAAGFALFCALFKWQPWHARLHLPIVCLLCGAIGRFYGRRWFLAVLAGAALLAQLAPAVLALPIRNPVRFLQTPRSQFYFSAEPALRDAIVNVANVVRQEHATNIGLFVDGNERQYNLQRAILDAVDNRATFQAFNPAVAPSLQAGSAPPDLVVAANSSAETMERLLDGTVYRRLVTFEPYTVYAPVSRAASAARSSAPQDSGR